MKRILSVFAVFLLAAGAVQAQVDEVMMRPTVARATIKETLTEDVIEAARPLNGKIDYIASTYDEGDLKALIKNYEMTNRKTARRQKKAYVPYNRKIDVNDPQKVKRYFHKRVDIIF